MKPSKCTAAASCETPAHYTYVWPWGEKGACCLAHTPLVEQQARQLGRENELRLIHVSPPEPQPAGLQERVVKLDLQLRELEATNGHLGQRVDELTEAYRILQGEVEPLNRELEQARRSLVDCQERNAKLAAELQTLRGGGAGPGTPPPATKP